MALRRTTARYGMQTILDAAEKAHMQRILQLFPKESVSGYMHLLGLHRATFYRLLKKHGLVMPKGEINVTGNNELAANTLAAGGSPRKRAWATDFGNRYPETSRPATINSSAVDGIRSPRFRYKPTNG